jgi:hypothetical protein
MIIKQRGKDMNTIFVSNVSVEELVRLTEMAVDVYRPNVNQTTVWLTFGDGDQGWYQS